MLDKTYIEELRTLDDKKEAKAKLVEYGESFGLTLKKSRSFDNLVSDIEEGLKALASVPMPEDNNGLSISDLIDADNEISGENSFIEGADGAKEDAKLLFDSPVVPVEVVEVAEKLPEIVLEAPIGETIIVTDKGIEEIKPEPVNEEEFNENLKAFVASVKESESFVLPENFSPHLILMGKNPGYVTLPWWIYEWIKDTPDWKQNPQAFSHPSAHQTLFSLIYYINRDGSVMIRETRNSSFVTLK